MSVFHDPVLGGLIRAIDVDNQTQRQSIRRYEQARAVVQQARAQLFPTVAGATSIRQSGNGNDARTTLTLQGSANWELDLFGRVRRQIESGTASTQAGAAGLALVRLMIQAELATNYFQLLCLESLQKLLNDTITGYRRSLAITQNQYATGVAARSDVITAQTQLQTTEASAIAVELRKATFAHAMALLSGRPPSEITIPRRRLAARPPGVCEPALSAAGAPPGHRAGRALGAGAGRADRRRRGGLLSAREPVGLGWPLGRSDRCAVCGRELVLVGDRGRHGSAVRRGRPHGRPAGGTGGLLSGRRDLPTDGADGVSGG